MKNCILISLMSLMFIGAIASSSNAAPLDTAAVAMPTCDPAMGPVYAYVDDKPVYAAEIAEHINELSSAARQQLNAQPGNAQAFVDNLLIERIITNAAIGLGLESTDTYTRRLIAAGDKILRDLYVESLISQVAPPSEAELGVYYRLHLTDYTRPATIRLAFILIADAATGNKVYREAKGGAPFDALQANWSTGTDSITVLQVDNMPAEMHSQIANLPNDGIFTPYATEKGVYIFKKLSATPMQIMSLDEVRDAVRPAARREKVQNFLAAFLETLKRDHPIRVVGSIQQNPAPPVGGQ